MGTQSSGAFWYSVFSFPVPPWVTGSNAIKSGSQHEQAEFYLMFSHLFLTSFVDIILNLLTGHEAALQVELGLQALFFFAKPCKKKKFVTIRFL